jgi:hypothetical protein
VAAVLAAALPLFLTLALFSRFPLRKFPLDGFIGEEFADFWQQAVCQYFDFVLRDFRFFLIVGFYDFALPCLFCVVRNPCVAVVFLFLICCFA